MSPSLVEDFDGGKGLPTYVEVDDTDVELETSKAAPKARADKGKGRARAPIPLGSPIDIDDDDEPVVPKKRVSTTLYPFNVCLRSCSLRPDPCSRRLRRRRRPRRLARQRLLRATWRRSPSSGAVSAAWRMR